jgi:hypothetical protein
MTDSPLKTADFRVLDGRIRGLTTSLLAAAIVLALGLALGWQVAAWWREKPPAAAGGTQTTAASMPTLGVDQEFLTESGLLKVEHQTGELSDAIAAMRERCLHCAANDRIRASGPSESRFVAQLLKEPPLEQSPSLALYQPPGQSLMVVAIHRDSQQIVGWSLAVPRGEREWSLYHFRPK